MHGPDGSAFSWLDAPQVVVYLIDVKTVEPKNVLLLLGSLPS